MNIKVNSNKRGGVGTEAMQNNFFLDKISSTSIYDISMFTKKVISAGPGAKMSLKISLFLTSVGVYLGEKKGQFHKHLYT